ncbi:hypothetical protein [Sinomonas atrocyanea]
MSLVPPSSAVAVATKSDGAAPAHEASVTGASSGDPTTAASPSVSTPTTTSA